MNYPIKLLDFILCFASVCIMSFIVIHRERQRVRAWRSLAFDYHMVIVGVVAADPMFARVACRIASLRNPSTELAPWENDKVSLDSNTSLN